MYNHSTSYQKEWKHISHKDLYINIHFSFISHTPTMKIDWLSINRRMDKDLVVHQYNGIHLSNKKRWTTATCSTCEFQNNYAGCKKPSRERRRYTEWFHVYKSKLMTRKYEVIYRDRKKFSGCLGRERRGRRGRRDRLQLACRKFWVMEMFITLSVGMDSLLYTYFKVCHIA